ncbi:MAG: copper amine oxidase N-terminal domain-containing protein [Heliobacteriaceae bacterium]|nr:copper amine oxidase N-terminal domain-containing protein [Heliobacteriaceae bacterium]
MSRGKNILTGVVCLLLLVLGPGTAGADTNYRVDNPPTVVDGGFQKMGKVIVEGTTAATFSGDGLVDRAEFHLPSGFYFTSVGTVDDGKDDDVEVEVVQGFQQNGSHVVTIRPIVNPAYPSQHRAFEVLVNKPSLASGAGSTVLPQLTVAYNRVYVPKGTTGAVTVTIDRTGSSAFSAKSFTIAQVSTLRLNLSTEKTPSLMTGSRMVGPIVISENMPGAFQYIELTLPTGFTWNLPDPPAAVITPGLGLVRDLALDGTNERDYEITEYKDTRYGQSVLRIQLTGESSTVAGNLRIECLLDVDETKAATGDVNLTVAANTNLSTKTLKIGSVVQQGVSVSAQAPKSLFGGLRDQEIAEITITEVAPETLSGGRKVVLVLPSWAKWDIYPTVQVQGTTELDVVPNGGIALPVGTEGNRAQFTIIQPSQRDAGRIVLKDAKVSLQIDAPPGDLKVKLEGTAGATGEVTVGTVKAPLTFTAADKPTLHLGKQGQAAANIEIKEAQGRVMLAQELWVEFPAGVFLAQTPKVRVTGGNLDLGMVSLVETGGRWRLIIPVQTASSAPATITISEIVYGVSRLGVDGDLLVKVGGPAVNEVNLGAVPLFPGNDWVGSVANATVVPPPPPPKPVPPPGGMPVSDELPAGKPPDQPGPSESPASEARNILFFLGEAAYRVNGKTLDMDIAPYLHNDRVYVPLGYAGQAFGIRPENILWDGDKQAAVLFNGKLVVKVILGENAVYRFETRLETDAAAEITAGRMMIPLRALATAFDATVEWEAANQMAKIVFKP